MIKKTFGSTHVIILEPSQKTQHQKHCKSRSCRARFPASHGSLYAAVYSRQLSRILACLAALARLGVTPRFARPKHLASLGRVTALPRFARPGLALQMVRLCGCRIRGRQTGRGAWRQAEQATQGLELKLLHFYFTFTSLLLHFDFTLILTSLFHVCKTTCT